MEFYEKINSIMNHCDYCEIEDCDICKEFDNLVDKLMTRS